MLLHFDAEQLPSYVYIYLSIYLSTYLPTDLYLPIYRLPTYIFQYSQYEFIHLSRPVCIIEYI